MTVPLAAAFVRLEPDTNTAGFVKEGQAAGKAAGEAAGKTYADGFYRDASGRLRQANGRFATDAQKRMIEGGAESGRGFGDAFSKEGGSRISRGFGKLKAELGPLLIPLGLGAAVAAIGQIGMTYEDNLNILQAVTKATGKEMETVAEKARQLGTDVELPGVSAAGAAAAMNELAKAGFTVEQAMDAAKGTLQLARVASMSEADAATIAANAVNAFGIEAKDTMFVVDELAAAANTSSLEVKDASDSFKMAASVFSAFQTPAVGSKEAITELSTAIAILGNNGIRGSDAGTSLKQMLLQLTGPAGPAKRSMEAIAQAALGADGTMTKFYETIGSGKDKVKVDSGLTLMEAILSGTKKQSEEAQIQLDALNPSLADVGDIAYDASGKMRPLRDIINLVTEGLKNETEENRNLAITQIFGADASRAVISLMKGGLGVYDKQREAILQQGAAADFAAAKNAGLRGAIDAVKGQLENAAISIYNAVKGPLTTALFALADGLGKTLNFIEDNIGVIRDWAVAIALVTAAIKLNSFVLTVVQAGGLVKYAKGVKIVTGTTKAWTAAQALLNATMLLNPIGLVIIAIVALIAAVVLAYRNSETFRRIVDAAWAGIKKAIGAVVDWFVGTAWPALKMAWQAVADAAMWLWRNVLLPAWNGIKSAVSVAVGVIMSVVNGVVAVFRFLGGIATWLHTNIFMPVFAAIRKVIEIWWLVVQIVFKAFENVIRYVVGGILNWLYKNIVLPVFNGIKKAISTWWAGVKIVFGYFTTYIAGPLADALRAGRDRFVSIFKAVRDTISGWWRTYVKPVFDAVKLGWESLSGSFTRVYNSDIKPLFNRFVSFIKVDVVAGFKLGVKWITDAWAAVRDAAKKPVEFVVNKVINPFIGGLNKAAEIVGVKDRVELIKGFANGGQIPTTIPGYAAGGRIAGPRAATDNRQAMVSGLGPVKLMGGEFIVNARDTAKALPLLKWVNAGMKGGLSAARKRIGRGLTERPGDGSEGWAFADGGLVGWAKDVWGAITNPTEALKKPFESMLNKIPGIGRIKDFLIGSAKRLLNGAVNWLTGIGEGGGGGNVGKAQAFVRAQDGKPYVWASAGPGGYDCSGIVSAVYNIMKGKDPYSHTFSTGSLPGGFFAPGKVGALMAGWSHPGQRGASANVGHMAGRVGNLPFESTGSAGVRIGGRARGIDAFAQQGAARFADGGQVMPRLYDGGGRWPSGTLGMNASGHTEHVMTGGPGGDMDRIAGLLADIHERLGELGGDVASALERPTRRAIQLGRSGGVATAR